MFEVMVRMGIGVSTRLSCQHVGEGIVVEGCAAPHVRILQRVQ